MHVCYVDRYPLCIKKKIKIENLKKLNHTTELRGNLHSVKHMDTTKKKKNHLPLWCTGSQIATRQDMSNY